MRRLMQRIDISISRRNTRKLPTWFSVKAGGVGRLNTGNILANIYLTHTHRSADKD